MCYLRDMAYLPVIIIGNSAFSINKAVVIDTITDSYMYLKSLVIRWFKAESFFADSLIMI